MLVDSRLPPGVILREQVKPAEADHEIKLVESEP